MTAALTNTGTIAGRHVRFLVRQPWYVAILLMQPLIYLVLFSQLFRSIENLPGFRGTYLDFLVPAIIVMNALNAGGWAGTTSIDDMDRGVLNRLLVTPVRRSAVILGHLTQQALLLVIQSVILVGISLAIGAHFATGLVGIGAMTLAAVLLGAAIGALSHAVAIMARSQEALIGTSQAIILPMTFLSTAFMVPQLMPDWIRTVAGYNPLTWAIDAARIGLDPAGDPASILLRLGWLTAFLVVSIGLALAAFRRYRRTI
jgi:ABC-2 type transport system permease protein